MKYYIYDNDLKEVVEYYETYDDALDGLSSLNSDGIADQAHHWKSPYEIKECDNRE